MAIVQAGDPVLRRPAEPLSARAIRSSRTRKLLEAMQATLREIPGVGLAAPQIGVGLRVVIVQDLPEYMEGTSRARLAELEREVIKPYVLINPVIEPVGEERRTFFEGCLSVEGYRGLVERAHSVRARYTDIHGDDHDDMCRGWHARILQHEVDHLDGTLYVDRMATRSFMTDDHYDDWLDEPVDAVRAAFGIT
ncbi:MAG: peptide deformylase [Acidimicrobiia bacterium]